MIELRVDGEVVWSGTKWELLVQFARAWMIAASVTKMLPRSRKQPLQAA